MTNRLHYKLVAAVIVLVTAGLLAGWWSYGPIYQRKRLLSLAERSLEAHQSAKAEELLRELLKIEPAEFIPISFMPKRCAAWDGIRKLALLFCAQASSDCRRTKAGANTLSWKRPRIFPSPKVPSSRC